MLDRCTETMRAAMTEADGEATGFRHEYVGTEHVLLALLKQRTNVAQTMLKSRGVKCGELITATEHFVVRGNDSENRERRAPTPRMRRVLDLAVEEARLLNHHYVGTEHLLLGLFREEHGIAALVLQNRGLTLDQLRQAAADVPRNSEPAF